MKDSLAEQQDEITESKFAKTAVDDELKQLAAEKQAVEKAEAQSRAEVENGKLQLQTLERELENVRRSLDGVNSKLDNREEQLESRTRERDKYDQQSDALRNQLASLEDEIAGLAAANENILHESKEIEKGWQEKITKKSSIEAELRAHIKKLEALIAAELRNARQGIMTRIDDMEAVLDTESRRVEDIERKTETSVMSIIERKAS